MGFTPVKFGVIVLLAVAVLSGIGIGSYFYIRGQQVEETQQFNDELRDGLVKSCERNGNPLREAVQKMLRQNLAQSNPETIRRFFPQIPPHEIQLLLAKQIRETRQTIREIAPVDCASLYP